MDNKTMMKLEQELNDKFNDLVDYCMVAGAIDLNLYTEYDVKRGLRDASGKGVLTGLTEISDVVGYKTKDGKKVPCDGELYYHGYNVVDLIDRFEGEGYGFERITYLLLFGQLPNEKEFEDFKEILSRLQELSGQFVRDVIMKAPSANIMNALQKSVLTLYSYDDNPDDISVSNVLRQSLQLIGKVPMIAVYAYQSYRHFRNDDDLYIRTPKKNLSISENILQMLRKDGLFTPLEAKVLDAALILHAEHGGGNNSTFTNHVVTSSGTDTYSATSAAIASLKGPRHGGANLKVLQMFDDIKEHCKDWTDEEQVKAYLEKILNHEAF
ncbi:MAG: citrate synthase, partial [Eubacterium sp.]|nr:citrate synthase [Eubacterium sp.]